MVNVNIIVEGGVIDSNVSAQTVDNSNALRQSLYGIFSEALGRDDVSVAVHMASGNRAAAKAFLDAASEVFLFTDLDTDKEHKEKWFLKMNSGEHPIEFPEEKKGYIFFMVQEMEAWILKQPEAIEKWAADNGFIHFPESGNVADHRLIAGKDVETIEKPSEKLADIIKQTFQSDKLRKNGKPKGVIYGKLKTAPGILSFLDIASLVANDTELQSFCKTVACPPRRSPV